MAKKESLKAKNLFFILYFSLLFPGLDPFLALAGSRCRTKVPHPPPNLPKWQDHHGVKPPAQRVIRPGPGRQREKNGFVLTTPWYDTPCSHGTSIKV